MERSEKALVPEWLKVANGGTTGGGGSTPHLSASSTQSERTTSSCSRRSSSSNGAMMHDKDPRRLSRPCSSFGSSQRERTWEKDHDLQWENNDISDFLTHTSRIRKDKLMRSQSLISGKQGEVWPRRVRSDISNGLRVGGNIVSNIQKAAFERDFPSLDAETKQSLPNVGRISSPGLSAASQSLPIGAYAVTGGEGWTSALAQLPVPVGSNSTLFSSQHPCSTRAACVAPSTTTSRNMAEALAQTPAQTRTTPQFSVENQRLEELAIKQSRQLIPMTPSMPKTLVLNSSEKLKSKTARSSELSTATKVGQQPPSSQFVNHSVCGITGSDVSKPAQSGNLTVLKATHEKNDASSTAKDGQNLTNTSRVLPGVVQPAAFAPLRSLNNPKLPTESNAAVLPVTQNSIDRRRPSQSQNRIDFFNSLRQKTLANHSSAVSDAIPTVSVVEKSNDQTTAITASVSKDAPASGPDLECSHGTNSDIAGNGEALACEESKTDVSSDDVLFPDEEEAAFLRLMGWEENAEAAAPLTEEEINAFSELLRSRPSSKRSQGVQKSKIVPFESQVGGLGGTSSILSSSDSEAEA